MKQGLRKVLALGALVVMSAVGSAAWWPSPTDTAATPMFAANHAPAETSDIGDGTSPVKKG